MTLAWMPHPGGTVDGFVLEVDDGNNGKFRVNTATVVKLVSGNYF